MDINLRFFTFQWKLSVSRQWIQFGIVVAAILASTMIAYWGSIKILALLFILIMGVVTVAALLIQPSLGYFLMFLGGVFIAIEGPGHVNTPALVLALMLGLWFWKLLAIKHSFQITASRVFPPVVVFLVIAGLALGMGRIPWFVFARQAPLDAQIGGFAIFVLSAGALLMTAHIIRDERWLKIIVWTFIGLGAVYMTGRALGISQFDRLYMRGFTANSMFWTWLIALSLSQAIFNHKLRLPIRALLVMIVLVTFYVAVVQAYNWKSGWIPALVTAGILIGLKFPQLFIVGIPFVPVVGYLLASGAIGSDGYSWGTRLDAWKIVLEISKVNPVLGLGFANYYWYTPLFPIRGWFVSFNSHSQYVDLIAQVGIVGLLCFLWIFFEVGRLSWGLMKQLPNGFANAYAYGVFAGLIGSLIAAFLVDWILPFVYNIGFGGFRASIWLWVFFGGLVSIEQMYRGKTKT